MTEALLTLLRVGLWEKSNENDLPALQACDLSGANLNDNSFMSLVWGEVLKLAEEQSVVGLVTAGLEKLPMGILPLTEKLKFAGRCQLIEQRNVVMNCLVAELWLRLKDAGIKVLLVKGQGVSQCYERSLWRKSGDVDFLVDKDNYKRTIGILKPIADNSFSGGEYSKEFCLNIDAFLIEVHGSLRTGLSSRIDKEVDAVQKDTFANGRYRVWHNGETDVLLPAPNNDVFFVFTHFIKHFYKEGMHLRQLCDWCRLMWVFRKEIDSVLLEKRLQRAGLMYEWKSFSALAVSTLGMPIKAMPLYEDNECWHKKGQQIMNIIMNNNGSNKMVYTFRLVTVFPWKTICYLPSILLNVNRLKIKERLRHK